MSKTYTQQEVDKIIKDRLSRREDQFNKMINELGFESVEQVKNLKNERDSLQGEFDTLKGEVELNTKRSTVKALGVDDTFVDFLINTVEDGNYEEYITANPKFKAENFSKGGRQPLVNKTQPNENEDKMREAAGLPPKK